MHIPKSDTQHTEILTFEEAQKHREESAVYDREKWLYIPDFYSEYRYILGTAGKKPLITIGINPSTAEPDNLDNTLKSVERTALFNGFDSFIMFNVYAQRATNPDHMDKAFNRALADDRNASLGVGKAQIEAMLAGSMFGWDVPAADPKNYDGNGKLLHNPKDRGDAR